MISSLSANSYLPVFTLQGVPKIKNNEVDLYKIPKGFSMTAKNGYFISCFSFATVPEIDLEKKIVKLSFITAGRNDVYSPVYLPLENYIRNDYKGRFKAYLAIKMKELLKDEERSGGQGIVPDIEIKLPKIALPKAVRSIMGKSGKAGSLRLDGSQRLTMSGSSTKSNRAQQIGTKTSSSLNMEMRQDLDLTLKGKIGDKININVKHKSSSETVIPEPDVIKIDYEGYEDEIIKTIDAGNISLALGGGLSVSSSTNSEGLFGIRSNMEIGSLKLTTFIAKDEAKKSTQKYTGDSQADSTDIRSKDYVNRTHYFIDDPYLLYQIYTDGEVIGGGFPSGWANNAIHTYNGQWILTNEGINLLPEEGTVKVYLDDGNANNNNETVTGNALNENIDDTFYFEELIEGIDYYVDYDTGIITMTRSINKIYTIGITYTRTDGVPVGNYLSIPRSVKLLRIKNQSVDDPANINYWNYQVRNIYNLGLQNIKSDGFSLNVYKFNTADNTINRDVPKDIVDTGSNGNITTYNEYLRLDTNGNLVVDSDDSTINLSSGYIIYPFLRPFEALEDSIIYQKEGDAVNYDEFNMHMGVRGQIGRDQVNLNQMGILPGSVVVKLGSKSNQKTLKESVDYIIDYDFGIISFLTSEAKNPEVEIEINFQYRPLFAIESKTLMGIRADMDISDNFDLGGTFIYQSERVSDDRPKIGNENRLIMLANLDGNLNFETPFLTKLIDWLPLIKTDEESKVTLSGEVAVSLPQIFGSKKQNDKKEAYIDDMESTIDSYPLGVTFRGWVQASKPFGTNYGKAGINWYNPTDIYARDIYDPATLTDKEEREKVSVLTCRIDPPSIGNPGFENKYWAGLMKYVGNEVDFSKKKYIEIMVKIDEGYSEDVTMHLDLGDVNEDFFRPGENEDPDTEDGVTGNPIDGILDYGEDVGLDGIENDQPGDDPFDDYDAEKDSNGDYPNVNNTENNRELDTEDLNGNGSLDEAEIYFEYSTSLADTTSSYFLSQFNGWKLFRIPLHGVDNYRIITNQPKDPNLEKISYARVWFETEDLTRLKIVNLDIVGNKWEEGLIKVASNDSIVSEYDLESDNETILAGVIDNQKDPHYTPAPGTTIERSGEITLEQSLTVEYNNLQKGHYGVVTQQVRNPNNQSAGMNLLGYNKIRFWVYSEKPENYTGDDDQEHNLLIRLGADSLMYYEIKYPITALDYTNKMLESGWQEIEINFSEFTYLKTHRGLTDSIHIDGKYSYYLNNGYQIGMHEGNTSKPFPNLTNINEISLGLEALDDFSGRIIFDDIRVAQPYEDIGVKAKSSFNTTFADFATLNIRLDWNSPNFQTSTARDKSFQSSSLKQNTSFDITNKYFLNKFFPAEWGLSLPLTLVRTQSQKIPRYKTNSDILRDNLNQADKEREVDKGLSYEVNTSYSMNKTPKNKILAFTLKNTSLNNLYLKKNQRISATAADTSITYGGTYKYNLSFDESKVGFKLFGNYKFFFFPKRIENTLSYSAIFPDKWVWKEQVDDSLGYWQPESNSKDTKIFDTTNFIKYDLFSDISTSYRLVTKRDLMLKSSWDKFHVGQEKDRNQTITLDYTPKYIDKIVTFGSNVDINYKDEHIILNQNQEGEEGEDQFKYKGSINRNISGNVTLKNNSLFTSLVSWLEKPDENENEQHSEIPEEQRSDGSENSQENIPEEQQNDLEEESEEDQSINDDNPDEMNDLHIPDHDDAQTESGKETDPEEDNGKPSDPENINSENTENDSLNASGKKEKKRNIFVSAISYIGRLENIKVNYTNNYSTNYDNRETRPQFLYQLGVPNTIDSLDIQAKTLDDKYSISSGFPILKNLTTEFSFSQDIKRTFTGSLNKEIKTVFPNFTITLRELEKLIKSEKILTSSSLSSNFVLTETLTGDIHWNFIKSEETRINLQPLLSWTGNWVYDISSSVSLNYSNTKKTTHSSGYDIIKRSYTQSIDSNVSWSFKSPSGIKIPFLKKRFSIKNEVTTSLRFSYNQSKSTTDGQQQSVDSDKKDFLITPGLSYKFSKNITGELSSSYDYDHNKKTDYKITIFSLNASVRIDF